MRILAAGCLVLIAATASAEEVAVRGVGAFSCGKYLQLRAEGGEVQNSAFVSWIWGYMAGFNMEAQQPMTREPPDQPSTLAYVDKYCSENPLDNVVIGTNALIHELGGKRNGP